MDKTEEYLNEIMDSILSQSKTLEEKQVLILTAIFMELSTIRHLLEGKENESLRHLLKGKENES